MMCWASRGAPGYCVSCSGRCANVASDEPGGIFLICSSLGGRLVSDSPQKIENAGMFLSENASVWSLPTMTTTSGLAFANVSLSAASAFWQRA